MTERRSDALLESQLRELYTSPEPNTAFTRQLRARLLEQAAQRRPSRFAQLWVSLTNTVRFTSGLTEAALILLLVLFSASLLAGQNRAQEAAPGLEQTATTFRPPTAYYTPPQLAPSVCETLITPQPSNASSNRPGKLIGGGVVKSGDFQISLYLFCDPTFRPESEETYSEIAGLGIYQSFWYNGPDVDEPESKKVTVYEDGSEYTQVIPAVTLQRGSKESQKSGIIADPTAIPDWNSPELPMRYLYTIRGAQGRLYGAALSFRLVNTTRGFVVRDIQTEALSAAALAQIEGTGGFLPIYPTAAPESLHPLLGELKALQEQRESFLFAGAGWIHQRVRQQTTGDPGQDPPAKPYPKDTIDNIWYKIDESGRTSGIVTRESRLDANNTEWVLREYAVVMENNPLVERPTFDDGVFDGAVYAIRHGGAIRKQIWGKTAQYTITTGGHETRAVFDLQTGILREVRYYTIEKDGSRSLHSTVTTLTLEHTIEVPPEIRRYFEY